MENDSINNDSKVGFFFLGYAVGLGLAVLFAPKSGKDTVALLRQKANEGADYAKRTIDETRASLDEVTERTKKAVNDQAERLSAAVEAGKKAYQAGPSSI